MREGERRREKAGEGGRRREKAGEGGGRREKAGEGGGRREKAEMHTWRRTWVARCERAPPSQLRRELI